MKPIGIAAIILVPLFLVLFALKLPLVALTVLLAWILLSVVIGLRSTVKARIEDDRELMDPESRSLFLPVRRLTEEIEAVVSDHRDSAVMSVVGGEAVQESRRIRDQVAKALTARGELKRAIRERNLAAREADKLRAQADAAESTESKVAILSALEAKTMELEHYKSVEEVIQKIDAGTKQAQAALSEMKARLTVKAASEKTSSITDESDLRETIGRLKSLSVSYDEAEEMLQS